MTDDAKTDTDIAPTLARWLDNYAVAAPDAALCTSIIARVPSRRRARRVRMSMVGGAIAAFLTGAGVSYARVAQIDAEAMATSMLSYTLAQSTHTENTGTGQEIE